MCVCAVLGCLRRVHRMACVFRMRLRACTRVHATGGAARSRDMKTVSVWGCTLPQVLAAWMAEATCHLGALQTGFHTAKALVWERNTTVLEAEVTPSGAAPSESAGCAGASETVGPVVAAGTRQPY